MNRRTSFITIFVVLALLISACSIATIGTNAGRNLLANQAATAATATPAVQAVAPTQAPSISTTANTDPAATSSSQNSLLAAMDGTLTQIYNQVNPSVVYIEVTETASQQSTTPSFPFFGNPGNQGGSQVQQASGSGFVWDNQGHIVTNNHVVSGASTINVTFSDGTILPAKIVGTDPNADLAVIKVDAPANLLKPVTLTDSSKVQVGQMAIAIGNPFGLQGTMTMGIISAISRSLPVDSNGNQVTQSQGTYEIPDIIQTDAPINPGNSGGVLVNDQGQVVGVTAAIESSTQSSAGIGFVIPSNLVSKVVPGLIKNGKYDHPWLGISGTSLTPQLAQAMGLNQSQRGALVISVTSGGPAEKAGLQGSNKQATIDGQQTQVGGDVIIAVDGSPVAQFDDLVAYLMLNKEVGQTASLTIIRDGKQQNVEISLAARPGANEQTTASSQTNPTNPQSSSAYLGITGASLTAEIDQAMNLPDTTQGVLVEQVDSNSPAADAGIKAGTQQTNIGGQTVTLGGDVITGIDNQSISGIDDLRSFLAQAQPGQRVTLDILRGDQQGRVRVTLGMRPVSTP